ncbi:MAG: hypothetical protein HY899_10350 [Deltaproteobacteria bacterium]|nr:hypothetical protein [Deltaproteobacteria bacterium]
MSMAGGQLMSGAGSGEEKTAAFPSVEWFDKLAEVAAENEESYRRLGPFDCTMVVAADDQFFEVTLLGYGIESVRHLYAVSDAAPSHFTIEAPLAVWREMLESIRANGAADREHTLASLTFQALPMRVDGPDQLEIDVFYRYIHSLQTLFNHSAEIDTTY